MEELEQDIKDLILTETTIEITYMNNVIEIVNKNAAGYKKLHDAWLLEQPMFISDIYKTQMRDLNFAARNNQTSLNNLNLFFTPDNKEEALKFIIYMRKRDLTYERQKWTINNPLYI